MFWGKVEIKLYENYKKKLYLFLFHENQVRNYMTRI